MGRSGRILALIACVAAAMVAHAYTGGDGPTVGATTTVKGTLLATVGPGFSITLKRQNGTVVKSLARGTWKIVVDDKSSVHNFHLTGSGVNKLTSVKSVTKVNWTVTLNPGTYKFVCDPHANTMKGQFTVRT